MKHGYAIDKWQVKGINREKTIVSKINNYSQPKGKEGEGGRLLARKFICVIHPLYREAD
jgi:hypothetical protein